MAKRIPEASVGYYRNIKEKNGRGTLTLDELAGFGETFWQQSYKHGCDDEGAANSILDWVDYLARVDPASYSTFKAMTFLPQEQMKILWAARWVDQACPRVVVDEKFSALLMATDVKSELLALEKDEEVIVPPWKAFVIALPDRLLPTYDEITGKDVWIRRIFVHHVATKKGPVWNFIAESDEGLQLWRHGLPTHMLAEEELHGFDAWLDDSEVVLQVDKRDERVLRLIGRLILSTCLAMSDPNNFHEQKKSKGRAKVRRFSKTPEVHTFVLGRPIKIDCRPAIGDYLSGIRKGSSPNVRKLVRGHWKRQAHGPSGQLRKVIHVEPYWRGPDDAAIGVSTVKLGL